MVKTTLSIDGRKCPECEAHVNRLLSDRIKEAVSVKSSARKNESVLLSDSLIPEDLINKALEGSGYRLLSLSYQEGLKESFSYKRKKKFRS